MQHLANFTLTTNQINYLYTSYWIWQDFHAFIKFPTEGYINKPPYPDHPSNFDKYLDSRLFQLYVLGLRQGGYVENLAIILEKSIPYPVFKKLSEKDQYKLMDAFKMILFSLSDCKAECHHEYGLYARVPLYEVERVRKLVINIVRDYPDRVVEKFQLQYDELCNNRLIGAYQSARQTNLTLFSILPRELNNELQKFMVGLKNKEVEIPTQQSSNCSLL